MSIASTGKGCSRKQTIKMIEFFSNSRALLLTFRTNCPICLDGSHLPRWGLILPRIPPPTPVLYSATTHPFQGYVYTQNTPKSTSKRPFSWPELESRQNELQSGQFGPYLGKFFENLPRSGQRKHIHRIELGTQQQACPCLSQGWNPQAITVACGVCNKGFCWP